MTRAGDDIVPCGLGRSGLGSALQGSVHLHKPNPSDSFHSFSHHRRLPQACALPLFKCCDTLRSLRTLSLYRATALPGVGCNLICPHLSVPRRLAQSPALLEIAESFHSRPDSITSPRRLVRSKRQGHMVLAYRDPVKFPSMSFECRPSSILSCGPSSGALSPASALLSITMSVAPPQCVAVSNC